MGPPSRRNDTGPRLGRAERRNRTQYRAPVAQRIERMPAEHEAAGSTPARRTTKLRERHTTTFLLTLGRPPQRFVGLALHQVVQPQPGLARRAAAGAASGAGGTEPPPRAAVSLRGLRPYPRRQASPPSLCSGPPGCDTAPLASALARPPTSEPPAGTTLDAGHPGGDAASPRLRRSGSCSRGPTCCCGVRDGRAVRGRSPASARAGANAQAVVPTYPCMTTPFAPSGPSPTTPATRKYEVVR